jgi:hypothetical protein
MLGEKNIIVLEQVLNKKPHLKTVKEKCNICKGNHYVTGADGKINNCPSCVRTKSSMDG